MDTKHTPDVAYWKNVAHSAIAYLTDEQANAIAQMSFDAAAKGENSAVWHTSSILFGYAVCICRPCTEARAALAKAKGQEAE